MVAFFNGHVSNCGRVWKTVDGTVNGTSHLDKEKKNLAKGNRRILEGNSAGDFMKPMKHEMSLGISIYENKNLCSWYIEK